LGGHVTHAGGGDVYSTDHLVKETKSAEELGIDETIILKLIL